MERITDSEAITYRNYLKQYCDQRNHRCVNPDNTLCPFCVHVPHGMACDIDTITGKSYKILIPLVLAVVVISVIVIPWIMRG